VSAIPAAAEDATKEPLKEPVTELLEIGTRVTTPPPDVSVALLLAAPPQRPKAALTPMTNAPTDPAGSSGVDQRNGTGAGMVALPAVLADKPLGEHKSTDKTTDKTTDKPAERTAMAPVRKVVPEKDREKSRNVSLNGSLTGSILGSPLVRVSSDVVIESLAPEAFQVATTAPLEPFKLDALLPLMGRASPRCLPTCLVGKRSAPLLAEQSTRGNRVSIAFALRESPPMESVDEPRGRS
jgi:hypothetical protein